LRPWEDSGSVGVVVVVLIVIVVVYFVRRG
jgi:hypothetical protein